VDVLKGISNASILLSSQGLAIMSYFILPMELDDMALEVA
jgi:hypothetical protein